jgi:hypothetical protein
MVIMEKKFKSVFWILIAVCSVIMLYVAPQIGSNADQFYDGANGKWALEYYVNGDTTIMNYEESDALIPGSDQKMGTHMRLYGVSFEIIPAILIKYCNLGEYEVLIRQLLIALFGIIFLLFVCLIAKKISRSWLCAIITLLVVFFTPPVFNWMLQYHKNVPTAAGVAISIYAMLCIFEMLPLFKWKYIILAITGIALATSVRLSVGFIVVFFYAAGFLLLLFFDKELRCFLKKSFLKIFCISAFICLFGIALGLCFYPYLFYVGPYRLIVDTFALTSNHFVNPPWFWNGEIVRFHDIPQYVDLTCYLFTIPLFVFGGIILFFIDIIRNRKIYRSHFLFQALFLIFTAFFPIIYMWLSETRFVDWSHTMFVYASLAPIAGYGIYAMWNVLKSKRVKIVYTVIVVFCILPTALWQMKNYKYTGSYYNVFVSNPRDKYEIVGSDGGMVNCFKWLVDNELKDTSKVYRIMAKDAVVKAYAESKRIKNVDIIIGGARGFASCDVDYAIVDMCFLPLNVRKRWFPPTGVLYSEKLDGKPIAVVVKKHPSDAAGIKLILQNNFQEGITELEKAYNYNNRNFGLWYYMGLGYYHTGNYQRAAYFFTETINMWAMPEETLLSLAYLGVSYLALEQTDNAIQVLSMASTVNASNRQQLEPFITYNLNMALAKKNEKQ